jgi:hypothetical protein
MSLDGRVQQYLHRRDWNDTNRTRNLPANENYARVRRYMKEMGQHSRNARNSSRSIEAHKSRRTRYLNGDVMVDPSQGSNNLSSADKNRLHKLAITKKASRCVNPGFRRDQNPPKNVVVVLARISRYLAQNNLRVSPQCHYKCPQDHVSHQCTHSRLSTSSGMRKLINHFIVWTVFSMGRRHLFPGRPGLV